jgi:hypothetical protein
MFDTLSETEAYYATAAGDRHEIIYKTFDTKLAEERALWTAFDKGDGFGEHAFGWNWKLLVDVMPNEFKFLEIGVYKGRVMAFVDILARRSGKLAHIYGISPLTDSGDKYSKYDACDYAAAIEANFDKMGASLDSVNLYKGYSTSASIVQSASGSGPYDILFIDGCHDYEVVCSDIENYLSMLKNGGYLVMDDASLYLEKPFGRFIGHDDVCRAIRDKLDEDKRMMHVLAVGHNRVWRKTG